MNNTKHINGPRITNTTKPASVLKTEADLDRRDPVDRYDTWRQAM